MMVLLVRRAHVWLVPAVMAVYWPSGASACQLQQVMVLLVRRAQEW